MNSLDLSIEPSAIRSLSEDQKGRLADILDQYLSALDNGMPPQRDGLLEAHPDLAGPLAAYFDSLDELHDAAAGFAGPHDTADVGENVFLRDEKRLGDFRLLREIGHGGMGVVYEAQQISLDRRVAVKVLPFAAVLDSKQIARFKNEAQAAAQLDHPNIVSVYAVGSDRGVHFFAMQLIDGQPLDRAIEELRGLNKPDSEVPASDEADPETAPVGSTNRSFLTEISPDRHAYFRTVMGLGIQAAEALHAAHEYGVVHRDVKPSNLLLDGEGKLWVTDFGLARCQSDKALTQTGDLIGTMRYMSPEQTLGQSALVDQRTDIYSLGATLYELLALEPAFPGDDGADLMRRLTDQEPRALRDLEPKIPIDLQTVIHKAMARRREERYTTAQEFADDLRRVLEGKPTIAKPPTVADRLSKWTRRHQRLVVSVAVVCLLAAGGLAMSTVLITRQYLRAEQNGRSAERFFKNAQDAVERLGLQINERLADVPGAGQVRQDLLASTVQYYEDFVEEAKNDPSLRLDLALTYGKIATLTEAIGSTEQAIAAYTRALSMCEQLVNDDPGNAEYRSQLAMCHNNLALLLTQTGRTDEARRAYAQAIDLQSKLVESTPENWQAVSDLASFHGNLGLLRSETGDLEAAEASFHQAIRLQEQLLKGNAEVPEYLQELAASYNNLSTLYVKEQPTRAAALYEKALSYQQKAASVCPTELEYRSDVAVTYNNLGAVQSRTEELDQAAASYQKAINIQRELVLAAPNQNSFQCDLAVSFNNLGLVQSQLGQVVDADHSFREALALQERLIRQNPKDVVLSSSLGGIYNNLGIVSEELGQLAEAGTSYGHAVEYQRAAHFSAPDILRYRVFLSKHYYNYGRVMRRLARGDEAARAALARKELWPDNPERLLTVAEELAMASAILDRNPRGEISSEQCTAAAVETLQQAVDSGFELPDDLLLRDSFAALRTDRRFAELFNQ